MLIKTMTSPDLPAQDRPLVEGRWYHGLTATGEVGVMALCVWAEQEVFELGDGAPTDMTRYPILVEHDVVNKS